MQRFCSGIVAVVALATAGFATVSAKAAPITVDLLARSADASVVQVQYDPYYDAERWHNRNAWQAERLRQRDAWRAERFRQRDAWRAERFRERDAWQDWRRARRAERYWSGW